VWCYAVVSCSAVSCSVVLCCSMIQCSALESSERSRSSILSCVVHSTKLFHVSWVTSLMVMTCEDSGRHATFDVTKFPIYCSLWDFILLLMCLPLPLSIFLRPYILYPISHLHRVDTVNTCSMLLHALL
jgi:hypothetical protein